MNFLSLGSFVASFLRTLYKFLNLKLLMETLKVQIEAASLTTRWLSAASWLIIC